MILTLRDGTTDKVRHLYLSAMVLALRDGTTDKVGHLYLYLYLSAMVLALRDGTTDKAEESRRIWDSERCRLHQEIQDLRGAKRSAEEALSSAQQAGQTRAAELRSAYHQHQEELNRTKRECEREIRRLVRHTHTHTHW
ncbi:hypothetical protein KUCAC02_037151 [Chaenocephalus aceratus]|nr:hypothetical protein KUCAC02_037151 [Chaenocephalus aceratus]